MVNPLSPNSSNTPALATGWASTRTPPPPPPPPPAAPATVDTFERVTAPKTPAQQQASFEANIGDVARKIDGKVGFARNQGEVRFNDQFWMKTPDGIAPKPGVKPSDAMADYVANPSKYALDCAQDSKMLHAAAANQSLGADKFNELTAKHGGLDISFGDYKGFSKDLIGDKALRERPNEDPKQMPAQSLPGDKDSWVRKNEKPGDAVYFNNPDVTPAGRAGGFRGENAVYIGNNEKGEHLYFAHGMKQGQSIMTEKEIADLLAPHSTSGFVTRMDEISRPNVNRL
ncbi:MAG: hypothetical protein U1E65_02400 [Myxococcota bacterium]